MQKLTARQKEVLEFIAEHSREHGYSPTLREIAEEFHLSVKAVHDHVAALTGKGYIRKEAKKGRTLELVDTGDEFNIDGNVRIPLLGTVAAGTPILTEENTEGVLKIHRSFLKKNRAYFALKVRGDSMEGAGILDGDIAVIEQRAAARNGEIAVVMLDDEGVTLKTFYKERNRVRLQPANPRYNPIYCSKDVRVLGRLVQVIRSYG